MKKDEVVFEGNLREGALATAEEASSSDYLVKDIHTSSSRGFTEDSLTLKVSSLVRQNRDGRYQKPCEDFLIADKENQIFVLMDGATRFVSPGNIYPNPSPATQAARIICEVAHNYLKSLPDPTQPYQLSLKEAAAEGNAALRAYNEKLFSHIDYLENDYASAGGIISVIRDNIFYYAYLADPQAFHIHDNQVESIAVSQTACLDEFNNEMAAKGITNPAAINRTLYQTARNIASSPYNFGVFTGEPEALSFLEFGSVSLAPGDKILLTSDGLCPLWEHDREILVHEEIRFMMDSAERIEKEENLRSDDKAAILISIA